MNLLRPFLPAAFSLLLATPFVFANQATADEPGEPLEFSIETLDDGVFDLAGERGKWVVVNFWATWCSPCLAEMPELAEFDQSREDVRVIGLAYEEIEADDLRAFLKQRPAGYPVAIVDVYAPTEPFDVPRGLPMTYLIGTDGTVAKKFLGPVTRKELEKATKTVKVVTP